MTLENSKVKSFNPANPESTINNDAAPKITPVSAI